MQGGRSRRKQAQRRSICTNPCRFVDMVTCTCTIRLHIVHTSRPEPGSLNKYFQTPIERMQTRWLPQSISESESSMRTFFSSLLQKQARSLIRGEVGVSCFCFFFCFFFKTRVPGDYHRCAVVSSYSTCISCKAHGLPDPDAEESTSLSPFFTPRQEKEEKQRQRARE